MDHHRVPQEVVRRQLGDDQLPLAAREFFYFPAGPHLELCWTRARLTGRPSVRRFLAACSRASWMTRTGAERGDRHPKIGNGVLLGAGAKVLGNITIGDYAKVASGSVVLKPVPAHCTAAGRSSARLPTLPMPIARGAARSRCGPAGK